jgi:hypothetical protein
MHPTQQLKSLPSAREFEGFVWKADPDADKLDK